MTLAYSWPSLSAAPGSGCLSWCQQPCVSGPSTWSLTNMTGWTGELSFPHCVVRCYLWWLSTVYMQSPQLHLTLNCALPEAWSCFWARRRATALCQMRMMMWHFCRWTWSQVTLLSPLQRMDGMAGEKVEREWFQAIKRSGSAITEVILLFLSGSCDTDNDGVILSLTVETPLSSTGQQHMGVVSTNLQWGLKHLVAEPAVQHRKAVLGETRHQFTPHLDMSVISPVSNK